MTKEVDGIIAFVAAAKIPGIYAGYTTNGSHAVGSYHEKDGTPSASGRVGLAVDFDAPGNNPEALLACARLLDTVSGGLFELFHTPLGHSVKNGRRYSWTIADHVTHVHVAVKKGTFLVPTAPEFKPTSIPAVISPPFQHGDDMQSQQFKTASLDEHGNGYIDTLISVDKFVNLVPLGPSPDRDGYGWSNWYWSMNDTNGQARIEIEGGEPGKPIGFIAWRVD